MGEGLSCRFCHAKNFALPHHLAKHERSHGVVAEKRPRAPRPRKRDLSSSVRRDGTLPVECWCRAEIVDVPQPEVMACRTRSCGRSRCNALEVKAS